jgi:hypothetical protein
MDDCGQLLTATIQLKFEALGQRMGSQLSAGTTWKNTTVSSRKTLLGSKDSKR